MISRHNVTSTLVSVMPPREMCQFTQQIHFGIPYQPL